MSYIDFIQKEFNPLDINGSIRLSTVSKIVTVIITTVIFISTMCKYGHVLKKSIK